MFGLVVYFLIGTFIIAQIFQWATIYDDEKSIAWMLKWFLRVWAFLYLLESAVIALSYGIYRLVVFFDVW